MRRKRLTFKKTFSAAFLCTSVFIPVVRQTASVIAYGWIFIAHTPVNPAAEENA